MFNPYLAKRLASMRQEELLNWAARERLVRKMSKGGSWHWHGWMRDFSRLLCLWGNWVQALRRPIL